MSRVSFVTLLDLDDYVLVISTCRKGAGNKLQAMAALPLIACNTDPPSEVADLFASRVKIWTVIIFNAGSVALSDFFLGALH
ncbi:hypothetical protein [Brucella grignonensis]|nr:hypothetical protein [Brucella grignonensis]NKB83730.1 hypothetical protein [Brucella grignonensis]